MTQTKDFLAEKAHVLRQEIIKMIYKAQSGHPGGSLSMAELVSVLYYYEMNIDPDNPEKPGRDRLVLSKGHCCPAIYAILALKGYFPMEVLGTLREFGSILQGHPDMKRVPGIDMTTGSLGQGLSCAVGMAYGLKKSDMNARVYCLMGDAEINEGQIWEAVMAANQFKLDNIVGIVDRNSVCLDNGDISEYISMSPVEQKFESFGWHTISVDGHDIGQIISAFDEARSVNRPVCIIANTIKGKGVSFMENDYSWHAKAPNQEQFERAMLDLKGGQAHGR